MGTRTGGSLIREVTVQNKSMVQVKNDPTSPKALIMTGSTPGLTKVTVLTSDMRRIVFEIVVEPEQTRRNDVIKRTDVADGECGNYPRGRPVGLASFRDT
ncbi:MAG: hypothetical protein U0798_12425 [Gemmataceae bacterium]